MKKVMTAGKNDMVNTHDLLFAYELNTAVVNMLDVAARVYEQVLPLTVDLERLNRLYVNTVVILDNLYDNNSVLSIIEPKPIWQFIRIFDGNENDIVVVRQEGYFDDESKHIGEIKRILILNDHTGLATKLADKEEVFLSKINKCVANYDTQIKELLAKREKYNINLNEVLFTFERYDDWAYYVNGKLLVKPRGGIGEQIIDKCFEYPNQKIDLRKAGVFVNKGISAILNDLNISLVFRKMFFPVIRKNEIVFRPKVTRQDIIRENIDISGLTDWRLSK